MARSYGTDSSAREILVLGSRVDPDIPWPVMFFFSSRVGAFDAAGVASGNDGQS